jgi:hypothetical protein
VAVPRRGVGALSIDLGPAPSAALAPLLVMEPRITARTIMPMMRGRLPYEITPISGSGLRGLGDAPGSMEISVGGFGEVTTAMMAGAISEQTGIEITADDIVNRAIESRLFAPGYEASTDVQKRGAALVAMAKSFVDGGEVSSVGTRLLPIVSAFGLDKTIEAMRLCSQLGLTDILTSAGEGIAGSMLAPLRDLVNMIGEAIGGVTGSSEFFADLVRELGAALGKLSSDVASMIPIISAGYKLCSMFADWINGLLMLPPVSDKPAQEFARDPLNLYLYLCKELGYCDTTYFGGSWNAWFNPFYQETFVHNSDMRGEAALRAVRAIEIGGYSVGSTRLPDWRTVLSSEAALAWVRDGEWNDPPVAGRMYFPGHSAENVVGCPCHMLVAGGYGGVGSVPGRWHQGTAQFRAAALSACYISANVSCVKGEATWSGSDHTYVDPSDHYELGYGPDGDLTTWWARWDEASRTVKVLPPEPYYGWARKVDQIRTAAVGTDASSRVFMDSLSRMGFTAESYIDDLRKRGQQRCVGWMGLFSSNEQRGAMADWLATAAWLDFPIRSHPYMPLKGTRIRSAAARPGMILMPRAPEKKTTSSGLTTGETVVAVGGVAAAVALVTKLLKVW